MSMREEFETWECDADQGPQTDPVWLMYDAKTNTYPLDKIQGRWEAWQASRAALEIELPVLNPEMFSCNVVFGHEKARSEAERAITAAGLKVRP